MAMINETAGWVENIYLIEPTDPVEGGEHGVDNRPHIELANRTAFLKQTADNLGTRISGLTDEVAEVKQLAQQGANTTIITNNISNLSDNLNQEIQNRTNGDTHLQSQIDVLKEQIAQLLANGGQNNGGVKTPVSVIMIDLDTAYSGHDNHNPWGMKVSAYATLGGFIPVIGGDHTLTAYHEATITIPDWVTDSSQVTITITNKVVNDAENYITLDIPNHRINITQARKGKTLHPAGRVVVTFFR